MFLPPSHVMVRRSCDGNWSYLENSTMIYSIEDALPKLLLLLLLLFLESASSEIHSFPSWFSFIPPIAVGEVQSYSHLYRVVVLDGNSTSLVDSTMIYSIQGTPPRLLVFVAVPGKLQYHSGAGSGVLRKSTITAARDFPRQPHPLPRRRPFSSLRKSLGVSSTSRIFPIGKNHPSTAIQYLPAALFWIPHVLLHCLPSVPGSYYHGIIK